MPDTSKCISITASLLDCLVAAGKVNADGVDRVQLDQVLKATYGSLQASVPLEVYVVALCLFASVFDRKAGIDKVTLPVFRSSVPNFLDSFTMRGIAATVH